jgi:hypothetical protein
MDVIDANAADVRFLQAARHGEVLTPVELVEAHAGPSDWGQRVIRRIRGGETLGLALIHEEVPQDTRRLLLGHFVVDELADGLDRHYELDAAGQYEAAFQADGVDEVLAAMARRRRWAASVDSPGAVCRHADRARRVHGPLFGFVRGFLATLPAMRAFPNASLALRTQLNAECCACSLSFSTSRC